MHPRDKQTTKQCTTLCKQCSLSMALVSGGSQEERSPHIHSVVQGVVASLGALFLGLKQCPNGHGHF